MSKYTVAFLLLVVFRNAWSQKDQVQDTAQSANHFQTSVKVDPALQQEMTGGLKQSETARSLQQVSGLKEREKRDMKARREEVLKKQEHADEAGERVNRMSDRMNGYDNRFKSRYEAIEGFHSDSLVLEEQVRKHQLDSVATNQAVQQIETRSEEELLKRADLPPHSQLPDLKAQLQNELSGYQGMTASQQQSRTAIYKIVQERVSLLGEDYLKEVENSNLKTAKQLIKDKKRSADLPSKIQEGNTKRNPLSQKSMRERFVFGGNMSVFLGEETKIDAAPELSYLIYPKWSVGLGLAYQVHLNFESAVRVSEGEGLSTRMFSQYALFKGFSVRGEYDWFPMEWVPEGADEASKDKLLLGMVKSFSLGRRVMGNVQVLYNFMYDPVMQNAKRFEYRIGFTMIPTRQQKPKDKS